MTLRVKGSRTNQSLPAVVDPDAMRLADDPMLPRASFSLGMMMGRGYINGKTFDILPDGTISSDEHHSTVGTDEIWEVVNESGMDHPWHQHVNDAQVLSIAGGDASFAKYAQLYTRAPAWKDTIIIPKMGQRDLPPADPRLHGDDDVPLPHPRARGHRHDGHVAHHGRRDGRRHGRM